MDAPRDIVDPVRRAARIRMVVEDRMRRRESGKPIDDAGILSAHPDLMPELGEELAMLALIERARGGSGAVGGSSAAAVAVRDAGTGGLSGRDAIPGYEITREIHRGGQGVVYQAVQQGTKRTVAVKVMREGPFAGPHDRMRFEREAEILGRLNHPNIVTIHERGEHLGRDYFVMRFIDGATLDEWMARRGVSAESGRARGGTSERIREALELFSAVCHAVNAAHLNGIIHRDIKPSNVRIDAEGRPHVLDFGLAKPTVGDDEFQSMTESGRFVGSLPWASPEQVGGRGETVDVRTDVYSLGVVLYQMLTGRFPYAATGPMQDVIHNILHTEPARPRATHADIDEDVETIVLKCLNKTPDRRYQTAGELARDVDRCLAGEPIEARRDSFGYVLRKQLRRHRLKAAVAAAFVLVVTAGMITSFVLWRRSETARTGEINQTRIAQAALRESEDARAAEKQERERADANRAKAEAVNKFLQDMFAHAEPKVSRGREVTVKEILDDAARTIDEGAGGYEPEIEVALRTAIGDAYDHLGQHRVAQAQLEAALVTCRGLVGDDHEDVAGILDALAWNLQYLGEYDAAEAHFRRALDIRERRLGENHPLTGTSANHLAVLLRRKGDDVGAEKLYRRAIDAARAAFGEKHTDVATGMNNLAGLLVSRGELDEAESLYRQALAIRRELTGDDSPDVAYSLNGLASLLRARGDMEGAERYFRDALALRRKLLGPEHPDLATAMNNLAVHINAIGKREEAEALHREALAMRRKLLGDDNPDVAASLNNLAMVLHHQERYDEAEPLYRQTLVILEKRLPPNHPNTVQCWSNLADTLEPLGELDEALSLRQDVLKSRLATLPADHPEIASAHGNLGLCLVRMGRFAEAEAPIRECLRIREVALPAGAWQIDNIRSILGEALVGLGRLDEAEPLVTAAYDALVANPQVTPARIKDAIRRVIALHEAAGRADQADEWRAKLNDADPPSAPASAAPDKDY